VAIEILRSDWKKVPAEKVFGGEVDTLGEEGEEGCGGEAEGGGAGKGAV
jgi:hypothetical protein